MVLTPENVKEAKKLTLKQELVHKLFSYVLGKQEIGKVGAKEVEQMMVIAEAAAERILKVRG